VITNRDDDWKGGLTRSCGVCRRHLADISDSFADLLLQGSSCPLLGPKRGNGAKLDQRAKTGLQAKLAPYPVKQQQQQPGFVAEPTRKKRRGREGGRLVRSAGRELGRAVCRWSGGYPLAAYSRCVYVDAALRCGPCRSGQQL